jgi:AcrR family transcriptional regulator
LTLPRRTQQQRKADTRARLLAAAADLFARHGVDAVSVDSVAEAAGRTSGAVYAHFGSKQALLMALLEEWSQSLVHLVAAEFERSSDVGDRLRAVAESVVVGPSEATRTMLMLERELWLRAARDREVARAMARRAAEAHDRMVRGFAHWIEQGILSSGQDAETLATAFRALVVGLEMEQHVSGRLDVDGAAAAMAAVLGLRLDPPSATARRRPARVTRRSHLPTEETPPCTPRSATA